MPRVLWSTCKWNHRTFSHGDLPARHKLGFIPGDLRNCEVPNPSQHTLLTLILTYTVGPELKQSIFTFLSRLFGKTEVLVYIYVGCRYIWDRTEFWLWLNKSLNTLIISTHKILDMDILIKWNELIYSFFVNFITGILRLYPRYRLLSCTWAGTMISCFKQKAADLAKMMVKSRYWIFDCVTLLTNQILWIIFFYYFFGHFGVQKFIIIFLFYKIWPK